MKQSIAEFKVRFGETDAAGIVYFANYFKWMDQAFHELAGSLGIATPKLLEERLGMPLVEAHCEYVKPLYCDDMIKVVTTIPEIKDKVIRFSHEIYREDTLVAKGYVVRAWVRLDGEKLKAESIPDYVRDLLAPYKIDSSEQ
jgi:acyl-CoA thioester hydrolase